MIIGQGLFYFRTYFYMEYYQVTSTEDPCLPFIHNLYHSAFPEAERRDWGQLMKMLTTTPEMVLQLIKHNHIAIGYIIIWSLEEWSLIEHFAIDAEQRGKKYGETIMKNLSGQLKLILEVEPALSADAKRRITFYEKQGLNCLSVTYNQPSYTDAKVTFEMLLMSNITERNEQQFTPVINKIKEYVYFKNYIS